MRQREMLPDRILDEADEVELIDISPEALRSRLRHGNVYPSERALRALDNYFSPSNLTALRELALRRIAEKTTAQLEAFMGESEEAETTPWKATATERVMVAFDARPHAQQLLRDGWRLARALKAALLAVVVVPPGGSAATSSALKAHIQLAEDLGAEVLPAEGRDVAATLAEIAREHHVTQIVIGCTKQSCPRLAYRGR